MITEKNVANVIIVRTTAATAGMEGNNVNNYISSMSVGEPVVIRPSGVVVDATGVTAANTPEIKIGAKLTNGSMNWSDTIVGKNVKSITVKSYAAPTNQVDYIGYNGTSGSIAVINSNLYTVRLYINPLDTGGFMQQMIKRGTYKSTSSAAQADVAAGIVNSLIKNLSREPDKVKYGEDRIAVELVNSGTSIATSGGTIAVTKGSTYVTILGTGADAGKYDTDGSTIVAGDYIRFGHATTKTYPVYKVDEVVSGGGATTMVVKLNIPYQGASNSAIAAASVGVMPIANIGDFGIKLTGSAYASDPPKFFYAIPRWTTNLQDFGATTVTNSAFPSEGSGTYSKVSEMEQQFHGSLGNFYRAQVPSPTFRSEAVSTVSYAIITIEYSDEMTSNLGQSASSLKQLYVACDKVDGGSLDDANTGLGTVLDAFVLKHSIPCNTADIQSILVA